MEFTYEGLVRHGFGFYNPNHAAAFICALLPFVWLGFFSKAAWPKILACVASAALLAALAFTYSRTGLLVLALEMFAFLFFYGRRYAWAFLGVGVVFVVALLLARGQGRLVFDAAMGNRFDIWRGGLALFAANPWGVGLGNSGEIVSAFFLPEGVDVRTLVNSHLTLLCEWGVLAGILWCGAIIYALLRNFPRKEMPAPRFAAYVSFVGLLLSAGAASIFDWEVLFRPSRYEEFSAMNLAAAWVLFGLFLGLLAYLCAAKFSKKTFATALGAVLLLAVGLFALRPLFAQAPAVEAVSGALFVQSSPAPRTVVLFDDTYMLKSALKALKKLPSGLDGAIALRSWRHCDALPDIPAQRLILMGACSEFAPNALPGTSVILINPGEYLPTASGIEAVYIPPWDKRFDRLREYCAEKKIAIFDL